MPHMPNTRKLLDEAAGAAFAARLRGQNVTMEAGGAVLPVLRRTAGRRLHRASLYRLIVLILLVAGVLVTLPAAANATSPQLSGDAYYDTAGDVCGPPPPGYADYTSYPPLVLRGSLEGCWYTKVETSRQMPSGVYLETGEEVFAGTLNGGLAGTFSTTYRFEARLDPNGAEIRGRCQHPIVAGTGGFTGATGLVLFRDVVPQYFYRGHIAIR